MIARRLKKLGGLALRGELSAFTKKKLRDRGWLQVPSNRYFVRHLADAAPLLAANACAAAGGKTVLVIGDASDAFAQEVLRRISAQATASLHEPAGALKDVKWAEIGAIALGTLQSDQQLSIARQLVRNAKASAIPMEYVCLPRHEQKRMAGWDHYRNEDFVSPSLAREGQAAFDLYAESLLRFRQKTDIRDFLDLRAQLQGIVARKVPGNVAEFGSYHGHSGYLISRTLEQLNAPKRKLFMFDMFEHFPQESVGVDQFWSGTHKVDFEVVKKKFADRSNVTLVRGDFTKTLADTDTGMLSLAFIDCDSYRATRYLLETLWDTRLGAGSVVILEDYGHAALLGNRVAAHEFFDSRSDAYTFYSAFSGFFIAVKLG